MKKNIDYKIFPEDPDKTYGLMAMVKGESPMVKKEPEDTAYTYPWLVLKEIMFFMLLVIALVIASIFFNAPLEELANPSKTPNPAKAPWYFLGLQELLHYFSPLVAGILLPGVVVSLLVMLPYLDKNTKGSGIWFSKDRKIENTLFAIFILIASILTIIGTFFRGPSWTWIWPWQV